MSSSADHELKTHIHRVDGESIVQSSRRVGKTVNTCTRADPRVSPRAADTRLWTTSIPTPTDPL